MIKANELYSTLICYSPHTTQTELTHTLKETADYILRNNGGYITEEDGTLLVYIKGKKFLYCNDLRYGILLSDYLRLHEGFECKP